MEYAGGEGGVRLAFREDLGYVFYAPGPSGGYDGNVQGRTQPLEGTAGIAGFAPVMVHRGEQDLSGTALLGLFRPAE